MTRFVKQCIDFDQGVLQWPTLLILLLTIMATAGAIYISILPVSIESVLLWISIVILLLYTVLADKYDAIILNGALMALYIAISTY